MRMLLPLLMLGACVQAPTPRGGGIVSTNPCSDAILVRLVAPDRISAISAYSQTPGASSIPLALARRFRATAGTAEEVVALRPALVLASSFTPPATRDAYARAGLRTVYLDSPQTIAASEAQVRTIAVAVGEPARGERMVGSIERAVGDVSQRPEPGHERPDTGLRPSPGNRKDGPAALLYIAGDLATGSGTLLDEMLTRAGFANAAARYGLAYTGTLPAERLIAAPPAIVIGGGGRAAEVRRALLPRTRQVAFDRSLVNCGGPTIPRALARLAAIRRTL